MHTKLLVKFNIGIISSPVDRIPEFSLIPKRPLQNYLLSSLMVNPTKTVPYS